MAESGISIDYNTVAEEVGNYLGWDRNDATWSSTQNTDFIRILERATRMFYFPIVNENQPSYEWSFMRANNTITLVNGTSTYDLPDNSSGQVLDESTSYAAGTKLRKLKKVPEQEIRQALAFENSVGTPAYFAVRNKAHAPTTGQRFEMLVYPTPGAAANAKVITFRHVILPNVITSVNKYPLGGARHSMTFLAACMAAAEEKLDNDAGGPMFQKFQGMLISSIRYDMDMKDNDRGGKA